MLGENAVDAVLVLHAGLLPDLKICHEKAKRFENEVTVYGAAASAIGDLIRTVKDFQKEVDRLRAEAIVRNADFDSRIDAAQAKLSQAELERDRLRFALEYASQMGADAVFIRKYCREAAEAEGETDAD